MIRTWLQTPLLLTFVLGVAATKDALEDIRKHTADDVQNNRTTSTLQKDGKEEPKVWKDVKDGEILKLKNRALQAESSVWSCTPVPSPRSERTPKAPRSRSAPLPRLSSSRWCTWRFFFDCQCHGGLGRDSVKQLKRRQLIHRVQ